MSDHPAESADLPRGFAPAVRERHFARVAIEGPMGAGKTRLALQWAKIIAGDSQVAAIDTEHRRAAGFAPAPGETIDPSLPWSPPWEFLHHCWTGPFDPVVLVRRAEHAAEFVGPGGVIVIDSMSPFWSGRGGVQDIVDNSPSGWKVGGPVHRDMLDSLARLPCHLIVTMRSKTEWVVEEKDLNGRIVHAARRIGGAPDQRLGIDFEFEVVLTVDSEHRVATTTSSTPTFRNLTISPDSTGATAQEYAAWINEGVERISRADINAILAQFDRVMETPERTAMKTEFVARYGSPDDLFADEAPSAIAWVTDRVDAWLAPPQTEPKPEPPVADAPPEQPELEAPDDEIPDIGDGLEGRDKDALIHIARTMNIEIDGRWGASRLAAQIREEMAAATTEPEPEPEPETTPA